MFREHGAEKPIGTGEACGRRRTSDPGASDHGGYFFQPDDAGERAHFALLVFAELEQQRHRRRFQLLDFLGVGSIGIPPAPGLAWRPAWILRATARSAFSTGGQ